jgi:ABC-type branched-subunit amino acid transport system ATPase component
VIIDDGKSVHSGEMQDLANNETLVHEYLGASVRTLKTGEKQ